MKCKFPSLIKVFRSVGGRALVLLLCLCLSLYFSLPVNAASVFNYDRWYSISNSNYNSGTLTFPQNNYSGTGAVSIPGQGSQGSSNWKKTSITFIAPNTPPSTEFVNGNSFTTTFSLVTNNPYLTSGGTSRALDITCPILDTRFNTTDCQIDTVETVFDERHYIIWNFVITGSISTTTDSDRIVAQLDIVNFSDSTATLWVLPARSAYGEGSFTVIRNILGNTQQMNSYLSGISNALTNSNNYLSAINSLTQQILNKMDSSDVSGVISQQQITNNKLDALQSSVESQTEQQQDQYEAEKQEEAEREQQGNDDADELAGTFSFSLINPFALFADVFTDGSACVNIPYLSRLVGSTDTTLCPWFPGWVRSMLTPVISIVSGFFLFSYVWRWINSDSERTVDF